MKPHTLIKEMELDDEDIFERSLLDNYCERPAAFESLYLAQFASDYNVKFKDGEIILTERKNRSRIIRFVQYNKIKDAQQFFRCLLMLYWPWRDEERDLLKSKEDLETIYTANEEVINERYEKYNQMCPEKLAEYMKRMKEEEEREDEHELVQRLMRDRVEEFDENFVEDKWTRDIENKQIGYTIKIPPRVTDEQVEELMVLLNEEQRQLAYEIFWRFVKEDINQMVILLGSAGTGEFI
jgi:hypothetical protein